MKLAVFAVLIIFSMNLIAKPKQFPNSSQAYIPNVDRGFAKYLTKSLHKTNKIVLTYDDGPHKVNTPRLLDMLKEAKVKAVFFVLGSKITEDTKPILKRIISEGHFLSSHHWKHDNSNTQDEKTYKEQLKKSVLILEEIENELGLHVPQMYYRFPYGAYGRNTEYHQFNVMKDVSNDIYNENCINFAFWDVDTVDWLSKMTAKDIKDNIMAQLFGGTAYRHKTVMVNGQRTFKKESYQVSNPIGGGVVLMHDIHKRSIDATELLLKEYKKNKLDIISISDVKEFSYQGKSCVVNSKHELI